MKQWRLWGSVLVVLLVSAGCRQGLAFRADTRLSISAPVDRAAVTLPVRLAWKARDLPPGAHYAVFVDQSPQPVGEPVSWVARDDDTCRPDDGCPDAAYLAERHVYVTEERSLVVERVPPRSGDGRRNAFHEATIVILDRHGLRTTEATWTVQFRVEQEGS